ncbi:MAG: nickel-dependent lactate racemase [Candidatus Lokiarchaeota archaeon]|nr:nickel-dependent lactate racemase [Candidatus Lokiarchaeota archaeon]MBD3199682.1 nickel-dependent lactate racemase [Candidatus Lokiarchaeota archaeon]
MRIIMTNIIKIPWAAWREPTYKELTFPDAWEVNVCRMNKWDGPVLSDEEIKNSILNPISKAKLSELAKGKEKIVIVVDDMTRTTPVSRIIPFVMDELEKVGIERNQITILLALGAHKPMSRTDCVLKLGKEIVNNYRIENHHPYENLTNLGESSIGTPIDINTTYYNADLKISIGGVIPHPLAGFGGGAKIVLPGVCGIRTLEANHSAAMRGIGAGIGRMTGVREDIEEIADKVGLDFSINVILTEEGDISAITCGDFRKSHRKAMELGSEAYKTEVTLNNNVCFFNLFPEDSELNQTSKGFNFLMTAPNKMLERRGHIVLMSASYEGRGYHSLIAETGARLYENMGKSVIWRAFVKRREVIFYSPNINEYDLHHFFPKSVKLFNDWKELINELDKVYEGQLKAAIFPCSIQLAK